MVRTPNSAPKIVSAHAARAQLGQIMRRARVEHTRFVVDRRGEPQVVIMGVKDFPRTFAPQKRAVAAIRDLARNREKTGFPRA
jgi:prevent-host-death family protein